MNIVDSIPLIDQKINEPVNTSNTGGIRSKYFTAESCSEVLVFFAGFLSRLNFYLLRDKISHKQNYDPEHYAQYL